MIGSAFLTVAKIILVRICGTLVNPSTGRIGGRCGGLLGVPQLTAQVDPLLHKEPALLDCRLLPWNTQPQPGTARWNRQLAQAEVGDERSAIQKKATDRNSGIQKQDEPLPPALTRVDPGKHLPAEAAEPNPKQPGC